MLAAVDWDVALLQEAPPRWHQRLCEATGASGAIVRTSRNQLAPLRAALADRRPDLMASAEGGSNQILVRPPWRIATRRRLTLAWLPERRRMLWLRLEREGADPLCVANLHATAHRPARAAGEVDRAARAAIVWSEGRPLVLGGDFNVRPAEAPWLFERLARGYRFAGSTRPRAIDHLVARGLELGDEARPLPRVSRAGLTLSDHEPLLARFVG